MIPLWPIGSLRVRPVGNEQIHFGGRSQQFAILEHVPMDWSQVGRVYLTALATIIGVIVLAKYFGATK